MSAPVVPQCIQSLISGAWYTGSGRVEILRNKFSGEVISEVRSASHEQIDQAISGAVVGLRRGPPSPHERGTILEKASQLVSTQHQRLVSVMQEEAGFTFADAQGEVVRCAETLRLCADEARRLTGEMVPMDGAPGQAGRMGFTIRVPVGVVCAITPFNSPLNTVAHKIAPAFAAGNASILKPSVHTPYTANILAELLLEAGLPTDYLSVVHGGADVGELLLQQPEIRFVAFTGSTGVGRRIQQSIGLRRSQMELGSIAHTIVDAQCDVIRAVPKIVAAAYRKAGQVCTSVQVLLVHRSQEAAVIEGLVKHVADLSYGDPRSPGCDVGPLISEEAAIRVENWITESISQGAERLVGGQRKGSVVPPTLLSNTTPQMKVRREEIFGPVLSVVPFDEFEEAVALVNSTPYGLSTGLFTDSLQHALYAAKTLKVGAVHVNEPSSSRADLMPFGGTKDSGFGREGPRYAILEMTEEKLVTFAS